MFEQPKTYTNLFRSLPIKTVYLHAFPLFNPLSPNPTKWLKTLKQFVGNLPTNCLSVSDHFVKLALKGLRNNRRKQSHW